MSAKDINQETTSSVPLDASSRTETISAAQSLLSSGKRHLLVSSIPLAVSDLAESCELLAKVHGETAAECAEAYYYYGRSLLELSRLESGVLGNALEGVDMDAEEPGEEASTVEDPEKMSKDEKLYVEDKVAEALEENFENHDRIAKTHSSLNTDEGEEEDSMEQDDEEEQDEEGKETEGKEMEKGEAEEKPEDMEDEDPSNLQLAWEMLELAKVVYVKAAETATGEDKTEAVAKLGETYIGLGEVSLENENYSQAVADFTACLDMRQANLPQDSRSIAETFYQLGVAHGLDGKFEESEPCFNNSIRVLETRIANLGKMEASDNLTKEIADLQALVAEIKEKINDHRTMAKANAEGKVEGTSTGFSGSGDKPVSSIGVKRSVDLSTAKASGSSTVGSA